MKNIAMIIPCYNEEKGIGDVIDNVPFERLRCIGYDVKVFVIDNNSDDSTAEIARKKGAEIISEKRKGKGFAVRTGFNHLPKKTDIVVMLDGDNTYMSSEMLRLIEPIDSGFCDVVVGTRLGGKINNGSMKGFNRVGNWLMTFLVRVAYYANTTDVCSGYFAWDIKAVEKLSKVIKSEGFSIEMEMITKMAKMGLSIYSVPITYKDRNGTKSKLRPLADGYRILSVFAKNLFWKPDGELRAD